MTRDDKQSKTLALLKKSTGAGEEFDSVLRGIAASPAVALPLASTVGGRFQLRRTLGAGTFGVVYEAEDRRDGRRVALKMLRDAQPDWIYRFKNEFRVLQGFAHPNLVALHELFFDSGRWFFTMELLDGVDLASHVRAGTSFDEPRLRDTLSQLLEGLAVLHEAGKVHRDVKPSNVLVTREGRVVLLDFGLLTEATEATSAIASAIVGTPAYMAPEQAALGEIGPAADLYSVGVMLYELLTGAVPVLGSPRQMLMDKQTREPPPPVSIVPGIPSDLNALCVKLLRFQPALRPTAPEALGCLAAPRTASRAPPATSAEAATFVGRGGELEALRTAFRSSRNSELATVLVCGESGIGKSSLVRHFTAQLVALHPDTLLLEGRCYEREAVPYKAIDGIIDALGRRFAQMADGDVAALLPARNAVLAQVFPVLRRVRQVAREASGAPPNADPQELRQQAFLALRELFTRVAVRCPTVVAIDDLQWADDDGLRALGEVLRPPDPPPLLFIGTLRKGAGGGDEALVRVRAAIPDGVRLIELSALGHSDASELVTTLLRRAKVSDRDADSIAREAGGHPLFLEELARHSMVGGGARAEVKLDDAIWSRVENVDPSTRQVLELIAVAGKPLAQGTVAEALGEAGDLTRSVALLRASNLVRTSGPDRADWIEPYHDRVREAVLAHVLPADRRARHEALALALGASPHPDSEALAEHWREAGNAAHAASYAAAAGEQASRAFAFDRAAQWYAQARELLPEGDATRHELSVKLADTLANAGRPALAAFQFEAAAAHSRPADALALRRRTAEQLLRSGQFERGLAAIRGVLAAMGMRMPTTRFGAKVSLRYQRTLLALRGLGFAVRPPAQIRAEDLARIDTCSFVSSSLTTAIGGNVHIRIAFATRALLLALRAGDLGRTAQCVAREAALQGWAIGNRNWRRTQRLLRRAHELAERCGTEEARTVATWATGQALYGDGQFQAAVQYLGRCLEPNDATIERLEIRVIMLRALALLGRYADLRRIQQEGLRDALARGDVYAAIVLRLGNATLSWLVEDKPDLAERYASEAMREWSTLRSAGDADSARPSARSRSVKFLHSGIEIGRSPPNELPGLAYAPILSLTSVILLNLYRGDAETAHSVAGDIVKSCKHFPVRARTLHGLQLRASSALAMLERNLGSREALIRELEHDTRALAQEGSCKGLATAFRAGLALRRGARADALAGLEAAARDCDAAHMKSFAAAARDRAARLRDDGSSAVEIANAAEVLRAEGVASPDRMIALLLPGFGM